MHAGRNAGSFCVIAAILLAGAVTTYAGEYPTRAVKIVVPYPAGGSADVLPRILGDWLSRKWGQPVVIENRPGAAGNLGAEAVALAAPDGYTLMATPPAPLAINRNLYPKLAFDPDAFVPVTVIARIPNALIVNPKVGVTTVAELIALARANPDKFTYASQGNGTTSHLTAEMFKMAAGVKLVHVPYRGSAPALNGLLTGEVDVMFDNLGVSLGLVTGGSLKLLGVATERRLASLPHVPTIAETLPGFVSVTWFAVAAPPKTPVAIAEQLSADFAEALRQPEVIERMAALSAEPVGTSPQATAAFIGAEVGLWNKVITSAGIKLE
jgi:tripartite-type tricarboxylate transporter receptor subunit TctC